MSHVVVPVPVLPVPVLSYSKMSINIPAAIDEFSRKHPRRLQMSNIFSD